MLSNDASSSSSLGFVGNIYGDRSVRFDEVAVDHLSKALGRTGDVFVFELDLAFSALVVATPNVVVQYLERQDHVVQRVDVERERFVPHRIHVAALDGRFLIPAILVAEL